MKRSSHWVWLVFLLFTSCAMTVTHSANQGRLKGTIGLLEGNCMPSPNSPPCKPRPVEATLYITKPTKQFDLALLVDSVRSDAKGQFEIAIDSGEYSVFAKYESEVSCSVFQCNPTCACNPIKIAADSISTLQVKIDKATY